MCVVDKTTALKETGNAAFPRARRKYRHCCLFLSQGGTYSAYQQKIAKSCALEFSLLLDASSNSRRKNGEHWSTSGLGQVCRSKCSLWVLIGSGGRRTRLSRRDPEEPPGHVKTGPVHCSSPAHGTAEKIPRQNPDPLYHTSNHCTLPAFRNHGKDCFSVEF